MAVWTVMPGNVSAVVWACDANVTSWAWNFADSARGICLWSFGGLDGRQRLGRRQLHGCILWWRRSAADQSGTTSTESTWHGTWHHRWHVQYTCHWIKAHLACQQVALSHVSSLFDIRVLFYILNFVSSYITCLLEGERNVYFTKTEITGSSIFYGCG